MERFLRYSLERNRPIRLMLLSADGTLKQVSAVVEKWEGGTVSLYILRPPKRIECPISEILAASYMPKDEGE